MTTRTGGSPLAPCREITLSGWSSGLADSSMRDGQPSVNGGTSRNSSASSSGVLPSFGVPVPVARDGASSGESIGDFMSEIADEISQDELSDLGLIGEEFLEAIAVSNR